jgi:DNA-binding response OmpR family regulator
MGKQQVTNQGKEHQHILVVDDGVDTRLMLKLGLQRAGYAVSDAGSGKQALQFIRQNGLPQLIVLDILMPDMDGFAFAKEVSCLCDVPIIFLSALSDTNSKVEALTHYAEDYVTKPFNFDELLSRIRRVLRRVTAVQTLDPDLMIDEQLRINFDYHYIRLNNEYVMLTPLETRLMYLLYSNRGQILSPDFLMTHAWAPTDPCSIQTLWLHIRRLRVKIEPHPGHPRYILTVRGKGYSLPQLNERDIQFSL